MANNRQAGPTCQGSRPSVVDDGTTCRAASPLPGPVGKAADSPQPVDLGILFRACLNPQVGLTEADYQAAAKKLGVEVEAIKAVAAVESPRGPYDGDGRPSILFERHYFHRLTKGAYDKTAPGISNASQGGYGKYSAQYGRLQQAFDLMPEQAMESTSWGRFQIMGSNYKDAGYSSVSAMVQAMMQSEKNQLDAFVSFVLSSSARANALQQKNWAAFAKAYNGKAYRKNAYDKKLQQAYEKLKPASSTSVSTPPAQSPARILP